LSDNGSELRLVQNEFETTIKKIRSDNGSEFKNTRIEELCDDLGTGHQLSPTYTPQSNGVVERKNRTLIDMAISMLTNTMLVIHLGVKLSTRLTIVATIYIAMESLGRHHMSY